MTSRTVSIAGAAVVVTYAALLAVNALVAEPLSVAPGRPLAAVYAHVDAMGNSSTQDLVGVLVVAGIGAILGIGVGVLGIRQHLPTTVVTVLHLGLVVLGAAAVFQSSWFLGMDLADSYPGSGGPHTVWPTVLGCTSAAAVVALLAVLTATAERTRRRTRQRADQARASDQGAAA
ncbi:hypothetical protein ACRQ4C_16235 [Curtobacterium sp. SP.BCp]|uniref:hypothetical protein n=1 Tax=unclassified Curtobacterium TaxID=257496 RepID=UPI0025B59B8C|nr:hypothetical protein [Curtobacterium sp. 458]WJY01345.1 hypothetical protein QPJ90_06495 [Curtobacterium sp. 458]